MKLHSYNQFTHQMLANDMLNAINNEHSEYVDTEMNTLIFELQEVIRLNYANFKIHEENGTMTHEIGLSILNKMDVAWLWSHRVLVALRNSIYDNHVDAMNRFSWQWYQDCIRIRKFTSEYEYVSCLVAANWI